MGAVDPSYPLTPLASFIAAGLLVPVLLSSLVRESWNLGVIFLCFWLICQNVIFALNAVLWADNVDVKLYAYCEISSHLRVVADIVKPMSTLIIMRRLHSIASLQPVDLDTPKRRRRERVIEWTLGFVIPIIVSGPLYLGLQGPRLEMLEGFGCSGAAPHALLVVYTWYVMPALVSVTVYYPKIAMRFYRQGKNVNRFLHSAESGVSRVSYIRILALASIDLVLTLPINVTTIVMVMLPMLQHKPTPFYLDWPSDAIERAPVVHTWEDLIAAGASDGLIEVYFVRWTTALLSVIVFAILGWTKGAREVYGKALSSLADVMEFSSAPGHSVSWDTVINDHA
ncbi:unnamed protein product [Peniophora sp. CBMAI 1063]|nr:unnamed protein product [Peniophora sp. CBMAI 1063]